MVDAYTIGSVLFSVRDLARSVPCGEGGAFRALNCASENGLSSDT